MKMGIQFMVKGENTRHFSDGMNRHMVSILWGKCMEVTHGRGYVYSIQYHIVWCVKYRHKILTLKIENRLIELLYQIAKRTVSKNKR